MVLPGKVIGTKKRNTLQCHFNDGMARRQEMNTSKIDESQE